MRHNVKKTGLRKTKAKPKAMARNLLTSLFKHDVIKTTDARATRIAPMAEKIVTAVLTKEPREAIRYIDQYITEKDVAKKIMEMKESFGGKTSGFTSIHRLGYRDGDAAPLVQIKLNVK
jgi:large subunit ribosomal protein L17